MNSPILYGDYPDLTHVKRAFDTKPRHHGDVLLIKHSRRLLANATST